MATKQKILIVDDDENIAELISLYLTKECFETKIVYDGESALLQLDTFRPNLILLDLMLPGIDGYQVCREIRKSNNVPIIMLSAKGETFDKVLGLELGADDYIIKPFEIVELLARVEVVLRRYNKMIQHLHAAGIDIDTVSMTVKRDDEEIQLTNKEYELLLLFARNPGIALYKEPIYERVWGGEYVPGSRTVELHIQRMRKKVGWEKALITIPKVGYRLVDTT